MIVTKELIKGILGIEMKSAFIQFEEVTFKEIILYYMQDQVKELN